MEPSIDKDTSISLWLWKSNQAFEYVKSLLKALESEHFSLQLLNFFALLLLFSLCWTNAHYAGIMLDASTIALCP